MTRLALLLYFALADRLQIFGLLIAAGYIYVMVDLVRKFLQENTAECMPESKMTLEALTRVNPLTTSRKTHRRG